MTCSKCFSAGHTSLNCPRHKPSSWAGKARAGREIDQPKTQIIQEKDEAEIGLGTLVSYAQKVKNQV